MTGLPGELLNHLWQSTLCAGAIGLLTLVLRKNRAAIRYRLWLAASLKFLVPFSLLVHLGSGLASAPSAPTPVSPMQVESTPTTDGAGTVVQPLTQSVAEVLAGPLAMAAPVAVPATSISPQAGWPRWILTGLLAIWGLGIAFNALAWLREWTRAHRRVRMAVPLEIDVPARIPAMGSADAIEPSVFGIVRPVLLLPANILDELPPGQIESILLHESAHVDRRDNLAAAMHMVVEALFWFNPVVWWIGTRLVDERERACDEDVLGRFDEPDTYAEAILNVCKLHLKTPMVCAAGVASSNLRERIEAIMNHQTPWSLDVGRKSLLVAVAVMTVCGPLFVGMVSARQPAASSVTQETAFTFSFISPPGATAARARGINNVGHIVGSFEDSRGTHGFLYSSGVFTTIDVPGSPWTIATGINNAGQIVGAHGAGSDSGNHGFLFSAGRFLSLDYPGSLDTIANGINNRGQIVGTYLGSDGFRHGFRLSGGAYTLVEAPQSTAGSAEGINDAGQIVGLSGDGATATGFVLSGSTFSSIRTDPNAFVLARALNNLGVIVGQDGGPEAPFRGLLRDGGRNLPIALPENAFAWNVQGVNDLGQLVGVFIDQSGRTLGYLATPTALRASPAAEPSVTTAAAALNPEPTRSEPPAVTDPETQRRSAGPPEPVGPPGSRDRDRRTDTPGLRGLNAVRSALQRSNNALGRGGPGNPFAQQAMTAVGGAIDNAEAAIAYVKAYPLSASAPAVPPRTTPAFEPPAHDRGRYPGRQIPLNTLRDAHERLAAQPGGDFGGLRSKMYDQIAAAANAVVADIVVTAREDDLRRIAGSLERTAASLGRRGSASDLHAQRASAAIQLALDGIDEAVVYVREHPASAMGPPPVGSEPAVVLAGSLSAERRSPGEDGALRGLGEAAARIGSLPGGDFGGARGRIQAALRTAMAEIAAGIDAAAERAREREREVEPVIDGLRGR